MFLYAIQPRSDNALYKCSIQWYCVKKILLLDSFFFFLTSELVDS